MDTIRAPRCGSGGPSWQGDVRIRGDRIVAVGALRSVNGVETVACEAATGNIAGTVLRSGSDTYTVDTAPS